MTPDLPAAEDCPRVEDMPTFGLGTWQNTDPEQCAQTVRAALEMGYRHVDTAQAYGNERAVGEGIAAADVDREEVFLATKVATGNLAHDDVVRTAKSSLERLGVEYVDLLYVHWPRGAYDPEDTLPAFAELVDDGLVRHAGVSNFEPEQLARATDVWGVEPFANQVELHPLLAQEDLREYCADRGIEVVGYSPLARGGVFDQPVLTDIADDHDVSAAQVALAWARQKGVTAIPKATGTEHLRDNWASLSLELSDDELERIDDIEEHDRRVDPEGAPWN